MTRRGAVPTLWLVAAFAAIGVAILVCALPKRGRKPRPFEDPKTASIRAGLCDIISNPDLREIISFAARLVMPTAGMEVILVPVVLRENK